MTAMSEMPPVLNEIEKALKTVRKWNEHVPLEDVETALVRAGVFVAWAVEENRRLERERQEAINDRHQARIKKVGS